MRAEKPKSTRLKKHRWCFHDLHSGRGFQPRFSLTLPSPSASSSWQRRVSCVTADSSVRFSECWLPFYLRNILNIDPVYRLVQTWTNKQDWSCGLARISQYDTYHNRGATTCVCVSRVIVGLYVDANHSCNNWKHLSHWTPNAVIFSVFILISKNGFISSQHFTHGCDYVACYKAANIPELLHIVRNLRRRWQPAPYN